MIPQIVGAFFAPWVGYHTRRGVRRPLLLLGFGGEPVRAALLAMSANFGILAIAQILDGITGAIIEDKSVLRAFGLQSGAVDCIGSKRR